MSTAITDREKYGDKDSELVFGLVSAVGTNLDHVVEAICSGLRAYEYVAKIIKVSDIFKTLAPDDFIEKGEYDRIDCFMDIGNKLRQTFHGGILAEAIAERIYTSRKGKNPQNRTAYIVKSLKHEEEVRILRSIYGNGFYLIGVYSDEKKRVANLQRKLIDAPKAKKLIERDNVEPIDYGQHTRDTFQMADFFIDYANEDKMIANVHRILDLIFNDPTITPTFGEYAMFMAFCSSLRSGDLSRQIGAAICRGDEVLATGANDCPKFGGGLYWHKFDQIKNEYVDGEKDFKRGEDPNKTQIRRIAEEIAKVTKTTDKIEELLLTRLNDITEFARAVHAEMEAISMCAQETIYRAKMLKFM
jgi:deoxycytidylate deaminase